MNKVAVLQHNEGAISAPIFDNKQIEILKNSICKGASPEEFEVFIMACKKTGLDPFMRQIYAVKRWDGRLKRETMTIQTGIDGYRLIAERTGLYAPGPEPTYQYDSNGQIVSATAYVKKQTRDGTWHTVAASAFLDEYCQRNKEGNASGMWSNMPRNQLAKCAEALALRRAFPAEMSGIYTKDEMNQAEIVEMRSNTESKNPAIRISPSQGTELQMILDECDPQYIEIVEKSFKRMKMETIYDLPLDLFNRVKEAATKNREEYITKQSSEFKQSELVETAQ
jgi:phage recombination protein Bet